MNFKALEQLIDSVITQYNSKHPDSNIEKKDVNIKDIKGTTVILELDIPNSEEKLLIQSEVISVDLHKHLTPEQLSELKNVISLGAQTRSIQDEEIVALNKTLKKENFDVADLLIGD